MPVPTSATACGLPAALSVMVSVALREPAALGVNETAIAQAPPGASVVPQLVTVLNSLVAVMSEMFSVSAPMLVTETSFGTVVVATVCEPKSRLDGNIAIPDASVDADNAGAIVARRFETTVPATHATTSDAAIATAARRRFARCPSQRMARAAGHINIGVARGSRRAHP